MLPHSSYLGPHLDYSCHSYPEQVIHNLANNNVVIHTHRHIPALGDDLASKIQDPGGWVDVLGTVRLCD